jgi:hypothetical protein
MHASGDMLDGSSDFSSAVRETDLRERVLALTSALRTGLDRIAGQHGDEAAMDAVRGVGRQLVAAGAGAGLAPLVRAADGFCGLASGAGVPWTSTTSIDALLHAVGLIEQVLDGCLEGMDADRLGRLCHAVTGRELGLDDAEDDDAIDLALDAAPDSL